MFSDIFCIILCKESLRSLLAAAQQCILDCPGHSYEKIYIPSEYSKMIKESGIKFEVITPNLTNFRKDRIFKYDASKLPTIFSVDLSRSIHTV